MPSVTVTGDSQPTRKRHLQTGAVLLLALLLRLLVLRVVAVKFPPGWIFTKGIEMGLLAKSVLAGHGLSSPFGPPTGPTAFIAPGYPLLIAGVFRLFGSESVASAMFIVSIQIVLSLVTVWLMMYIARLLFDPSVAIWAGLVWACSPPILWIPTIFWDTSLAICLLTGLVALVLRFRGRISTAVWLFLGAYAAVTALINPAMLPALMAIVGWLAWQQRAAVRTGILFAALAFVVVFSPWPIRNARVFHAFIPLRTTVGFELWMGNRPGATGFLDQSLFPSFNRQELDDYKARGELGYTAHKSDLAKQFILSHPSTFARLTAIRIGRYWLGTGAENGSALFALHAGFTSGFGLLGLWLLFRRKRYDVGILFTLPLLLFPFPYYITHAEFRYRLALDTLLTILAAYAIVTLYRLMDKRSRLARANPDNAMRPVHG